MNPIASRLTPRGLAVLGRLGLRFLPWVGLGLLAWELWNLYRSAKWARAPRGYTKTSSCGRQDDFFSSVGTTCAQQQPQWILEMFPIRDYHNPIYTYSIDPPTTYGGYPANFVEGEWYKNGQPIFIPPAFSPLPNDVFDPWIPPAPRPLPYEVLPHRTPSPDRGNGPAVKPRIVGEPTVSVGPNGVTRSTAPHARVRHRANVRERKVSPYGTQGMRLLRWFQWALGAVTEAGDIIDSVWSALPGEVRWTPGVRKNTPQAKLKDIWDHYDQIDIDKMMENLVLNQIEDSIIGAANAQAGKAGNGLGIPGSGSRLTNPLFL